MVLVIYLEISQNLNFIISQELIHKSCDIINEQSISASSNRSCFESFIKMFSSSNTSSYFPSYFLPPNLKVDSHDFNLLEYILSNQYFILDYRTTYSKEHIEALIGILQQYQSINDRILQ